MPALSVPARILGCWGQLVELWGQGATGLGFTEWGLSQLLSNALKLESLNGVWSLQQLHGWLFTALAFSQPQLSETPSPGSNLGFFCYWVYLGLRAPGGCCFCVFFCSDSSAHDKDLECSSKSHPSKEYTNYLWVGEEHLPHQIKDRKEIRVTMGSQSAKGHL